MKLVPDLYWSLPSPQSLISRVAAAVQEARALWINLPVDAMPGTWDGIKQALRRARISNVVDLIIREGTDIAADVGVHLSAKRVTGQELVAIQAPEPMAIVLRPDSPRGRANCHQYVSEFLDTLDKGLQGNVLLVSAGNDPELTEDQTSGEIRVVAFDGGLHPDEMDAYVALRMIDRPGPGSTRLTRSIVTEFAGFDVELAENLIRLDDAKIVNITDHLGDIMAGSPDRWRDSSWLHRTCSTAAPGATHVLHDHFLSQHGSPWEKEQALKRIRLRYWKACVKILTPWLEERRLKVVGVFNKQLKALAGPDGKLEKPLGNGKVVAIEISEIEYNNIVGLAYTNKIRATTCAEIDALAICKKAKAVRDDIAHLRMPNPQEIALLVNLMDRVIS